MEDRSALMNVFKMHTSGQNSSPSPPIRVITVCQNPQCISFGAFSHRFSSVNPSIMVLCDRNYTVFFVRGRSQVQISADARTIPIEGVSDLPVGTEGLPQIRPRPLLSTPVPIHHSVLIL